MIQEPMTLYKLMILYMLSRVDFPLAQTQVRDFILEREYTNYFNLHLAIGELIDTGMIRSEELHSGIQLTLTAEGANALAFFKTSIGETMRLEIDEYLKQHQLELRNEVSVHSDYYKSTSGEYEAHLVAKDKGVKVLEITLSVPVEETAASICENWQHHNQDIYQYLIGQLF